MFDFSISPAADANLFTSLEIPLALFAGESRIRLQDGVGICYAKLKGLLAIGSLADVPKQLRLTAADVGQYREGFSGPSKHRANRVRDRKIL